MYVSTCLHPHPPVRNVDVVPVLSGGVFDNGTKPQTAVSQTAPLRAHRAA